MNADGKRPEEWWDRFRTLLEDQIDWPDSYVFKFIVPKSQIDALKAVFDGEDLVVRASTRGNYLSVTARRHLNSSEEVIDVYKRAGAIEGLISL